MHLDSRLELSLGQTSFAGVKPHNEDSVGMYVPSGYLRTTKGICAVIADGVSSAEAAKQASDTCVTSFLSDYFATPETWSVKKSAHQVLVSLNRWLRGQGQRFLNAERGYVCTLSVAVFKSTTAHIFHVGDSRVYRFRNGELEQLTTDHATCINRDQTYLTRAMGLDTRLDVDYLTVDLHLNDVFLLTTDGIHDYLSKAIISEILLQVQEKPCTAHEVETHCQAFISQALDNGSADNLSCQIVRVDRLPFEDQEDIYHQLTALPFPPYLEAGSVLDNCTVEKTLCASNRSQLYLVHCNIENELLAMKTPSVNFEDDPAYIERFIMESWIGKRIDSPHVVKVIEPEKNKSCLYYLTQYIDGLPVNQWTERYGLSDIAARISIIEQIVKGVRAMHRKETLHLDLKPDNILVDDQGQVCIIDFGSCQVAGIAEIATPFERDYALGTANYSAPEAILQRRVEVSSDVFSIAVLSFELLTGQQPFSAKLENCRTLRDYANLQYTPSYHYNPHVPMWMDGALKKALSVSSALRYQDVSEFLYDLQHPNPAFARIQFQPLIEKNPLLFWQTATAILLVIQITTIVLML